MKQTVNYLLAMEKSLRQRLSQLDELKSSAKTRNIWERMSEESGASNRKIEEPTYDIKKVDAKITKINRALFEINHKIKESNAQTAIEVSADYDELISELE